MASDNNPEIYDDVITKMHDTTRYQITLQLRSLSDEELYAMWQHVCAEHFHPDTEFGLFKLEGKIDADEFVAVLLEEVDKRNHKEAPHPEPA